MKLVLLTALPLILIVSASCGEGVPSCRAMNITTGSGMIRGYMVEADSLACAEIRDYLENGPQRWKVAGREGRYKVPLSAIERII